jgi:Rha family phage regulatory protein
LISGAARRGVRDDAGKTFADSRDVAATFGKRHDHVLEAIRNLNCSYDFRLPNFRESNYQNEQGHEMPCFEMTRNGFTRLVMSFTGEKAASGRAAVRP